MTGTITKRAGRRLALAALAVGAFAGSADAVVFCGRADQATGAVKEGSRIVVRSVCRSNEAEVQTPAGPEGPEGPPGPSGSPEAYNTMGGGYAVLPNELTTLATATVAPGSYVVIARQTLGIDNGFSQGECWLSTAADHYIDRAFVNLHDSEFKAVTLVGTVQVDYPTIVTLECKTLSGGAVYTPNEFNQLVAIKVDLVDKHQE
jgi:hypothetical protein